MGFMVSAVDRIIHAPRGWQCGVVDARILLAGLYVRVISDVFGFLILCYFQHLLKIFLRTGPTNIAQMLGAQGVAASCERRGAIRRLLEGRYVMVGHP